MGAVYVKVKLLGPPERPASPQTIEALVDTGATLSIFPAHLLRRLGVKPVDHVRMRLADGRVVRRDIGEVKIKLNGDMVTTRAIFGGPRDATVVGLVALESLGLTVDPTKRRLVHTEYLMYSIFLEIS